MLMKEGMVVLSPYQVATIRILSAGLVLVPFAWKAYKEIPRNKMGYVILSGILGSFFPAYLFCIAETRIDSSLAGILNALTPFFVILVGMAFYQLKALPIKIVGMLIGFTGLCLLFISSRNISFQNLPYASLILLATLLYGINVNLVGSRLQGVGSLNIASIAFVILIIPCIVFLYYTGYFSLPFSSTRFWYSTAASFLLGVMGTAVASILFYVLLKRAGAIFASMVTYGIPFIAVLWGLVFGESITLIQVGCLGIILGGVYLVNKK